MLKVSERHPAYRRTLVQELDLHGNSDHMQIACRALGDIIEKELTPKQREMVLFYFYEEKTMQEIAEILGINKSTVSRTLKRAKERIRKYMQFYFDYTSFHFGES